MVVAHAAYSNCKEWIRNGLVSFKPHRSFFPACVEEQPSKMFSEEEMDLSAVSPPMVLDCHTERIAPTFEMLSLSPNSISVLDDRIEICSRHKFDNPFPSMTILMDVPCKISRHRITFVRLSSGTNSSVQFWYVPDDDATWTSPCTGLSIEVLDTEARSCINSIPTIGTVDFNSPIQKVVFSDSFGKHVDIALSFEFSLVASMAYWEFRVNGFECSIKLNCMSITFTPSKYLCICDSNTEYSGMSDCHASLNGSTNVYIGTASSISS
mmetsp:Transcript_1335/g.2726  ORF Transcript_1335/g.2726 Transcript_1335/m.2726 type:complete len:267 (-) Transcript_1335:210-1010(-)